MAIAAISNASAIANTVAMPSHSSGNYIQATVFRNGSTTAPTVPSGWTLAKTQTGTTAFLGVYYKFAASGSETTGTWTNASSIVVDVYSGVGGVGSSPTGGTGSGTTMTYPAITLDNTNSTSWVVRVAGNKSATNMVTNTPTGYTARGGSAGANGIRACDSNAGLASSPSTGTQATSPTGVWCAISVELKVPNANISTLTDNFNTGSTPDVSKWTSVLGSHTLSSGELVLAPSTSILTTLAVYNLTGDSAYVQAKAVSDSTYFCASSAQSIATGVGWIFNSSSSAEVWDSPNVAGPTGITRTHTSGDWYRVRESGGTIFCDYSSNGSSWTNAYSATAPFPTGSVYLGWQNGGSGTPHFDNFNVAPVATNTGQFFVMF